MGSASSRAEAPFLGRYRVVRKIASGGMAEVLLAKLEGPVAFERYVAIKRVLPHLVEDTELSTMFVDEAHLLARLRHPNVVSIEDFGSDRDELYLVMEFLEGETLAQCLKALATQHQRFPFDVVAYLVAGAAAGLHAAHELTSPDGMPLHLVHRDVSPQNLFVLYSGHPKIIDFGIARHRLRLARTETGSIKGKLRYMAPEQLTARPIDRRTDVFALGIVLFEMLTMRALFKRETEVGVANAILSDPMPSPRELAPSVPVELEEICVRALAREPEDRFPTAQAMCAALQRCYGERTSAEIESRLSRWMRSTFAKERAEKREWTKDSIAIPSGPDDAETAERLVQSAAQPPASLSWVLESTRELPMPSVPPPAPMPSIAGASGAEPLAPFSIESRAEAWLDPTEPVPSSSVPPGARSSFPPPRSVEGLVGDGFALASSSGVAPGFTLPSSHPPSFPAPPRMPPTMPPAPSSGPAPRERIPTAGLASIGVLALACAVLLVYVVRQRIPQRSSGATVVALPSAGEAPVPTISPSAGSGAHPTEPQPQTPADPAIAVADPDTATLFVATRPEGVEVWIDGRLAGTTPAQLELTPRDEPFVVELRRDARTEWREEIVIDGNRRVDVELAPRGATHSRPRPRPDETGIGIDPNYP